MKFWLGANRPRSKCTNTASTELGGSADTNKKGAVNEFQKQQSVSGGFRKCWCWKPVARMFFRDGLNTFWHQSGTAKMGRDEMSVVDGRLKVQGLESRRIADASILPRVTTGNTMAPCVVIGERPAEFLYNDHGLQRVPSGVEQSPRAPLEMS